MEIHITDLPSFIEWLYLVNFQIDLTQKIVKIKSLINAFSWAYCDLLT